MAVTAGPQPVRQGRDPRRPRVPRRRPARDRRLQRQCRARAATSPTSTSPATTRKCLTTDATKNTVNAFAKEHGDAARQPESFGIALAKHFVDDVEPVGRARIKIEAYPWNRLSPQRVAAPARLRPRTAAYVRTATVTYDGTRAVGGLRRAATYVVLKTTDSEFYGYLQERYTTLQADQRPGDGDVGDQRSGGTPRPTSTGASPTTGALATHERASSPGTTAWRSQQTMYAMGEAMIDEQPEIARGALLAAEQAPLRDRPQPVRAGEPERGVPRRRPALRLHRGHHPQRRRPGPRVWRSIRVRAGDDDGTRFRRGRRRRRSSRGLRRQTTPGRRGAASPDRCSSTACST